MKRHGLVVLILLTTAVGSRADAVTTIVFRDMAKFAADVGEAKGRIPNYVPVGYVSPSRVVSPAEFYFMQSRVLTFYKVNRSFPGSVAVATGTQAPLGALVTTTSSGSVTASQLLDAAQERFYNYVNTYNRVPRTVRVAGVDVKPAVFSDLMSRALRFYRNNGRLPSSLLILPRAEAPKGWTYYNYASGVTVADKLYLPPPPAVVRRLGKSLWIFDYDARTAGASAVVGLASSLGIQEIILLVKGTSGSSYFGTIADYLPVAHAKGVRVHAWIICFQDDAAFASGRYAVFSGGWIDPADANYRAYLLNSVTAPLIRDTRVDGITLDYARYPGNANGRSAVIDSFCADLKKQRDALNPKVVLSSAVMPEGTANATLYGQDYTGMSKSLDVLMPMTYSLSYNQGAGWVGSTVAYIAGQTVYPCRVQAMIQTRSAVDGTAVAASRVDADRAAALANGSDNVSYFRYPFTDDQKAVIRK